MEIAQVASVETGSSSPTNRISSCVHTAGTARLSFGVVEFFKDRGLIGPGFRLLLAHGFHHVFPGALLIADWIVFREIAA